MSKWVACETWGLCDFRRMAGPFDKKSHAVQAAAYALDGPAKDLGISMLGDEYDPGDDIKAGDWIAAQDGMISGPYKTKREAKIELADNIKEDYAGPNSPGHIARVVRVVHRSKGGRATIVVAECA